MAYIGNKDGPRESEIVERLGAEYFGISESDLESDVAWYTDEEVRGEVKPVHRDEAGRCYLLFSGPGGTTQTFYLEEHGLRLTGKVEIHPSVARS